MYIILLGAPGAGKGTQAVMLTEKLKLVQVASGDLFRQALAKETDLGKKAKSYMEKGQLVPDEITIQMVLERLSAPDCENGALLDGFPRNLQQAEALDKALKPQSMWGAMVPSPPLNLNREAELPARSSAISPSGR